VTAFTAIIQIGVIAAVVVYFARDIAVLARAWVNGLLDPDRWTDRDHRSPGTSSSGRFPSGSSVCSPEMP
jgi:undecaprenyl-diphosphatase